MSYNELAESDSRETLRRGPVVSAHQPTDHIDAVEMEVCSEESVEEVQLTDSVRHVQQLHEQVSDGQVAANLESCERVRYTVMCVEVVAEIGTRCQIAVELVYHVAECLLLIVEIRRSLAGRGRIDEVRETDGE